MSPVLITAFLFLLQSFSSHPAVGEASLCSVRPAVMPPIKVTTRGVEELGPEISAQSAAVIDVMSGAVLFSKRPRAVRPLASITKLLTAWAVIKQNQPFDEMAGITAEDIPSEGHTIFRVGDRVTRGDLLSALLVGSDNAAANTLARSNPGGREKFLESMRAILAAENLDTIKISEPSGLDPANEGSALGAARLVQLALNESEIQKRSAWKSVTVSGHHSGRERLAVRPTNILVQQQAPLPFRLVGGKTGYLNEAGYNFVLEIETNGHRVIIVTLGSATNDDRFRDARVLAEWVFRNYEWH